MIELTAAEERTIYALREADELWLELWQLAKRVGYGVHRTNRAVADLRRRGIVVKRPCQGLSTIEVSLARSGV